MRLSPVDPLMFNTFIGIGAAHFDKAEYDYAALWIEKGLREKPDAIWANRLLAASYFHAERSDEAKQTFAVFLERFPNLSIAQIIERAPGSDFMRNKFAEAFRSMGHSE